MNETSETFRLSTCEDTPSAISSQELESGPMPCVSPDGPMTGPHGLGAVPVKDSPRQAQEKGLLMSGTYGPTGTTSSASAALSESLGSKLRARMPYDGLTLFKMTWKERVTPLGRRICRLAASVLRTSGNVSGSWPTPSASGFEARDVQRLEQRRKECKERTGNGNGFGLTLGQAVQVHLSSWPTPIQSDATGGPRPPGQGSGSAPGLQTAAKLTSWATPRSTEAGHSTGNPERAMNHRSRLEDQVFLAASGQMPSGPTAEMGSIGQLNPAFPCWLQGLPPEVDACAPTGIPSRRR